MRRRAEDQRDKSTELGGEVILMGSGKKCDSQQKNVENRELSVRTISLVLGNKWTHELRTFHKVCEGVIQGASSKNEGDGRSENFRWGKVRIAIPSGTSSPKAVEERGDRGRGVGTESATHN